MSGIWDRIKGILGWGKREPDKREDDRVMYIIACLLYTSDAADE